MCWLWRELIWLQPDSVVYSEAKKPPGKPRGFFSIWFTKFDLDGMGSLLKSRLVCSYKKRIAQLLRKTDGLRPAIQHPPELSTESSLVFRAAVHPVAHSENTLVQRQSRRSHGKPRRKAVSR